MRKTVYTFIFGDYDDLKSPAVVTPGWDYICFTDDPALRSEVWDVRLSPRDRSDRELENKRYSTKHKALFHRYLPGYDLSLAIDACLELNCNLDDFMDEHFEVGDDMMIVHSQGACIYEEAECCKQRLVADPACIDAQIQRYRLVSYPPRHGLYFGGLIGRRHNRENVRALCNLWWEEYSGGSTREQLSLTYAIWKSAAIRISPLDYHEQFFEKRNFIGHPHKRNMSFAGANITFQTNHNQETGRNSCPERNYVGNVDVANCDRIYGWAADRNRPDTSVSVRLYDGDKVIAEAPANLARPDVAAFLGGSGLHGFAIRVPASLKDGAEHKISIRFEATDINLSVAD